MSVHHETTTPWMAPHGGHQFSGHSVHHRGRKSSSASKDPSIGLPRSPATYETLTTQPQPYLPRYRPHLSSFLSVTTLGFAKTIRPSCFMPERGRSAGMSTVVNHLSNL
ncbi:uncharacterized protein LOC117204196 [Bombus bifarius]|uniref:Uncharacterized protein LOC117204196 n=1 Tax=Bombus bifarius TaxID=103933 RepID=A0A6P8LAZ5_9HYME|nr:uncharacterized protein LOC117155887 [Bombus vancouverensis nearcticus]XP_033297266.1 uncharacterized protein LOC117204196 [Bombus bifarius]